jgi:hypothetical protein
VREALAALADPDQAAGLRRLTPDERQHYRALERVE